jgi:hypothetical protein
MALFFFKSILYRVLSDLDFVRISWSYSIFLWFPAIVYGGDSKLRRTFQEKMFLYSNCAFWLLSISYIGYVGDFESLLCVAYRGNSKAILHIQISPLKTQARKLCTSRGSTNVYIESQHYFWIIPTFFIHPRCSLQQGIIEFTKKNLDSKDSVKKAETKSSRATVPLASGQALLNGSRSFWTCSKSFYYDETCSNFVRLNIL